MIPSKIFTKRHSVKWQQLTSLPTCDEKLCKLSGGSFSMTNLQRPMKMGLSSLSLMGLNDGFFLVFFPTQLTILRSKLLTYCVIVLIRYCRVLLCCIKYLGNLPCPRCLVHKSEIHKLGTKRDFKRRETKIRVDDDRRRMLVETARGMLYENGLRPNAKGVSELLASRSLTPTRVSCSIHKTLLPTFFTFILFRTPSPIVFQNTASTFTQCSLLI